MTTPVGPTTPPNYPSFGGDEKPNIGMTQNEFEGTADSLIDNAAYTGSSASNNSSNNSDSTANNDSNSKTQKQKEINYEFEQLESTARKDRQQTKAEEKQNKQNELSGG
ncbi:MAG: hypothetical protein H7A39_02140 [Chlamydiales bacterium]|nr:hypothetical protein [Chlamydiales bacterium]